MQKNQMKNKNIIITGANTGIGYETALDLAKQGARVILACRDAKKANEACSKIKEQSQNDKVEVEEAPTSDEDDKEEVDYNKHSNISNA
jgi:NAD(P)-dependent dehydrogenase (short-subunit alcohol dehydrogenase family)